MPDTKVYMFILAVSCSSSGAGYSSMNNEIRSLQHGMWYFHQLGRHSSGLQSQRGNLTRMLRASNLTLKKEKPKKGKSLKVAVSLAQIQ